MMLCDCEVYEICPSCAPSEPTYAKAAAANDKAARRRIDSSVPLYALAEIGELAQRYTREFQCSVDDELGTFLELSRFVAWLARREREGRDGER